MQHAQVTFVICHSAHSQRCPILICRVVLDGDEELNLRTLFNIFDHHEEPLLQVSQHCAASHVR